MEIPSYLKQEAQEEKIVLFLGAGASLCAKDAAGNAPPSGRKLGELLSNRFLGGKFHDAPLAQIAELAASESDLTTVQEYIKQTVESFEPSKSHLLLTQFKWAGLATTNYDRLIERAYEVNPAALQIPKPFIEDGDRVEDSMRDVKGVMLLKVHGCVSRLSNPDCPLILTTDQYVTHRNGRKRIFNHLSNWGHERTIVFVGSSLQDSDIRAILLELASLVTRPRYYLVVPKVDDIEARYWETKKITPIKGSFEDFMQKLDAEISSVWRVLSPAKSAVQHPIASKFNRNDVSLSSNCTQFLESDVDYVKAIANSAKIEPEDFYRGYHKNWSAIEQNLDFRRVLGDTITSDKILEEESRKPKRIEIILIKAHAGAGKTVLLRRIAWDAAREYDVLCLYLKPSGSINTSALQEIIGLCKQRIYLFVDDAADRIRELQSLIKNIEPYGNLLSIIAVERLNEWNVSGSSIDPYVTSDYELKYLTNFEVDKLIELLTRHHALYTLEGKSLEEQRAAFRELAGRQLLVALHEATLSRPFEDIIENEFLNIVPVEARKIYLTICVLNRLGVPVRAGIIARLHGVRFEEFKEKLFRPLEHVVHTEYDNVVRDFMYSARHPFIAEIVFDRILRQQEERYDLYIKCLNALNIDYSCDRKAFRLMVRGRSLLELFSNRELIDTIYEDAGKIAGEDGYLFHQKGLYEMHCGNHRKAADLFAKAEMLAPRDLSIKHSRSELLLKNAEGARTSLEKEKLLREATEIAITIKRSKDIESHAYHTLVKIDLFRLGDALTMSAEDARHIDLEPIVKNIEKNLSDGLQRFPGDSHLLTAESKFADLLNDSERVIDSLQRAFDANPRNGFIAVRLASYFRVRNDFKKATETLETALNANRNDRSLHYHFARHLMHDSKSDGTVIAYHLQRAFAPGDANYDAQLLYGRQLYINGDKEGAKSIFESLKLAKISPEFKGKLLYPLDNDFYGKVVKIEGNYAFISKDGSSDWVHLHRNNIDDSIWTKLSRGSHCSFKIGFNFYGPGALNTKIVGLCR
jgi:SIR2-like domain